MSMIGEQVADLREKALIFENSGCATDGIVKTFRKAADTIEQLSEKLAINSQPSADVPDTNVGEYIKLSDLLAYPIRLDHYDKKNGDIKFVYGVESVLEFAESLDRYVVPPADQWIPCSERLPDDMKKVLVTLVSTTGKQYVRTDHITHGRWWQFEDEYVKAWMPLPEPFKGEENV